MYFTNRKQYSEVSKELARIGNTLGEAKITKRQRNAVRLGVEGYEIEFFNEMTCDCERDEDGVLPDECIKRVPKLIARGFITKDILEDN